MKEITVPQPVALVDFDGEPLKEDSGEPAKPLTAPAFWKKLLITEVFAKDLDTIEAVELRLAVKRKLDAANGTLHLENDEHKRLLAGLKELRMHPYLAVCAHPLMVALRDARDFTPAVTKEPEK